MDELVTITNLEIIGSNENGYTANYFHERFGEHLIVYRKAGSISGRHYHKGNALSKNPEIIILISGHLTLNYKNINQNEIITQKLQAPTKIEIRPYVWHEVTADTDCAFIELNSLSEHEADTYYLS